MNRTSILLVQLALSLFINRSFAQPCGAHESGVINAPVLQQHVPTKKVIQPAFIREADYIWGKRVWRTIDLRQKFNYPLYYPLQKMDCRWSLFDVLTTYIDEGAITAYLPYDWDDINSAEDGDQFKYPLTSSRYGQKYFEYKKKLLNTWVVGDPYDIIEGYDPDGLPIYKRDSNGFVEQRVDTNYYPIEAKDVVQYKVKEDWFFDRQRSSLDVRILGLAPVVYRRDDNENIVGTQTLFWVYFPEARYVLQNFYVYNQSNDARRMSFDDLFWKRMFHSTVTKETNVYDREVEEYTVGVEALLESDRIHNTVRVFEHDLWSY